ncbi:MAG: hypothetical protein KF842_09305 [Caulobacter sp.]|nr:hypothetical protein [Caulobacter sp.]
MPPLLLLDQDRLARLDALEDPAAFALALGEAPPDWPLSEPLSEPLGAAQLGCWVPMEAGLEPDGWRIRLVWGGRRPFSRPFSDEDLNLWRQRPLGRLLRPWIDLDGLIARGEALDAPEPAGLIFHISRCGSTLLTRMLGAMQGVAVLSEPPPLEAMIGAGRRDPGLDEATQIRAIRAMAALLGRPRDGEDQGVVIKLDSWSLLDFALLRRAFPATPCVILHRDPAAVLASHARRRGVQMVPGLIDWRCEPPAGSLNEHGARLLGALCEAAAAASGEGRVLAYETLAAMAPDAVAGLFGLSASPADIVAMQAARALDAKAPDSPFNPRLAAGAEDADAEMIAMADRWARPAWRRLAAG